MASDIKEAIRRLFYQYKVEGADEVMATQEAVAASTTKTDKASLSLEKSFGSLERRYVETVRAQQDYAKVQDKVNAAVAQNPELQERANVVLAEAKKHFDNIGTGADKASVAATVLMRTLSRTIGPLALLGVAVAAVSSAMEFMEPIAVRVGADIYRRFSEAYPAAARLAEGIYNAAKQFYDLERAQAKLEAINAALKGTASSAQLAALKIESLNQKIANQRGLAEAAQAAERMADHVMRLAQIYPGVTLEVAKQLELMQAQLGVAQARSPAEAQIAQEKLRQVQLTQQGISGEEQQLIIAGEREIAEANIAKQKAAQGEALYRQGIAAAEAEADAAMSRAEANRGTERAGHQAREMTDTMAEATEEIHKQTTYTYQMVDALDQELKQFHLLLSLAEQVDNRLRLMTTQFGNKQYNLTLGLTNAVESTMAKFGFDYDPNKKPPAPNIAAWIGAQNVSSPAAASQSLANVLSLGLQDGLSNVNRLIDAVTDPATQANLVQQAINYILSTQPPTLAREEMINDLTSKLEGLTNSTDSLNSTMQNALSPFYSQDPRTTHLGFRAGVVGNENWLAPGASSQAGALAAVLGPGAILPGMANGGSFVVGGGYSANDNKIAAFPVASGEEVIVNRNRGGAKGGQVIHIDNRTIINGRVDADVFALMKVSKYQQAQRMRAGLSAA